MYDGQARTLDTILNISDNVVSTRSAMLEADKAYNIAYTPEEKNSAGIVTKPQKGYSPEQSKRIRDEVTLKVLSSQFNGISPDMIQTISSDRLVTTGLSTAQIESAKLYSSISQLAKMTSSPEADEASKIEAGITAYIQKYMPNASTEQTQALENSYFLARKLITGRDKFGNQINPDPIVPKNPATPVGDADDVDVGADTDKYTGTKEVAPESKPEQKPVLINRRRRRPSQAKVRKEPEAPNSAKMEDVQLDIDRLENRIAYLPDWSGVKPRLQEDLQDLYLQLRLLKAASQ
jgi:hypothetical protein